MTKESKRRRWDETPLLRFSFDPVPRRKALLVWYRKVRRDLPWRALWRAYNDPYHVWVSEIMLQQTVIKAVIPVYARFLEAFPTVMALANASETKVRQAVRGLGYYRRFAFMHKAAKELVDRRQCVDEPTPWPKTFDAWKALPGIGDYTAAAISSIAFNYPAAVVDGNVERVFCRLLDIREASNQPHLKRAFKTLSQELLAVRSPGDFNQALMELGQTVCTVSSPRCSLCPLADVCLANERRSQALAPAPKIKPETIEVAMRLIIVERGRSIALLTRPASARFLKGTLGFLTSLKDDTGRYTPDGFSRPKIPRGRHVGAIRHAITKHRIKADVEVVLASQLEHFDAIFVRPHEVEPQLVSNLDRKAWHLYLENEREQSPFANAKPQKLQAKKLSRTKKADVQ